MSKKSPVDSDNYYAYPAWFEGGNESNQSQPSTSSYSYPTLEYIWSNAVRLTRTTHSNLQDEIEYIEANLGGGNESCNCSALQFGIDSNTTKIENLSTIKLSRDGSQSMTGVLKCESGLETNTISSYSGDIIECTDNLKVNGDVVGDSTDGLNLVAEDTTVASRIQLTPGSNSKILLGTFSGQSVVPRIEIPEGSGNVSITIRGAHLIPYTDNDQDLGTSDNKWKNIYANTGSFTKIDALGASVLDIDDDIKLLRRLWGKNDLFLAGGDPSFGHAQIRLFNRDSPSSPGALSFLTTDSIGAPTERIHIWGDADKVQIDINNADVVPYDDDSYNLGSIGYRWKNVYAVKGNFSGIIIPDNLINLGPYSVIVYKDDTGVYAKDPSGNIIAQGDAGADDATVLKTALESGGKIIIMPATYTLYFTISGSTDLITLPQNTVVDGLVREDTKLEFYLDGSTPSNYFNVAEIVVRSNCVVRNLTIDGKKDYFEGKDYLQYLIAMREGDEKSKYDIVENVKLINSKRCGIVPDCSCSVIRNIIVDNCPQALDSDRVDNLLVEGYIATNCQNAFYFESDVADVTLRNFYFEPTYRGVYMPLPTATFENIVIEEGTIKFPSGLTGWDRYAFEIGASVRGLTVRNVKIRKESAHPGAFRHLVADHLGEIIIENCDVSYLDNVFTYGCSNLVIDGGTYRADYVFINNPTGFLVKNAHIYTTWHIFHDSPSNIHFENCYLTSLGSDGTESDITFRRCTIGSKKTDSSGTATISSGNTSVVVSHGLFKAPVRVFLTGTHNEVAKCWVTDISDTEFTINAPSAVTDDRDVYWEAAMS